MSVPNNANTFLPPSPVVPPFLLIASITNSYPAIVTVTTENNYVEGQLVHFSVPSSYRMFQINEMTGKILSVDTENLIFTVDIDTNLFDVFVPPPTFSEQPATISSGGSRNIYNTLNVPFHSEGNFGN